MRSRHDRWEYHLEAASGEPDPRRLSALGADGWELAAVTPGGTLIFKRPAPDLRERVTLDQRAAVTAGTEPKA